MYLPWISLSIICRIIFLPVHELISLNINVYTGRVEPVEHWVRVRTADPPAADHRPPDPA